MNNKFKFLAVACIASLFSSAPSYVFADGYSEACKCSTAQCVQTQCKPNAEGKVNCPDGVGFKNKDNVIIGDCTCNKDANGKFTGGATCAIKASIVVPSIVGGHNSGNRNSNNKITPEQLEGYVNQLQISREAIGLTH